ncbi:uncharacterized protein BT62DRAFT_1077737 [Guyanagaster necrorhizus]|uniref:GH16 domain-containing protein n=1 Tax=Guyanagaster necrorhizus TaxID=856835 RepID=A0A9P8AQR2_9AGAR|nr:uncharacterized protein BT62DRAFT_1077737 [Guyanagaster necrorhizus MCA 3950]KAG7444394.1 hypothetical protein BT62DRAFT_1077737 [Guyanagaster necrorhizus MCA 3950]
MSFSSFSYMDGRLKRSVASVAKHFTSRSLPTQFHELIQARSSDPSDLWKPTTLTKDYTNDKIGEGATINSTELFMCVLTPFYQHVFGQTIILGVENYPLKFLPQPFRAWSLQSSSDKNSRTYHSKDEVDVELLGGEPIHWSTNVFVFLPGEEKPMYKKYASVEDVLGSDGSIAQRHTYFIDYYNPNKIVWDIDGNIVRTLTKEQAGERYPRYYLRIQFGI